MRISGRSVLALFVLLLLRKSLFCESWVLAAKQFSLSESRQPSASEENLGEIFPQLILEKIVEGLSRETTYQELFDRSLDALLLERQSLFLQLSREVRARDSAVVSARSKRKLRKEIRSHEKKIAEIKEQIDQNLEISEKLRDELEEKTARQGEQEESEFSPLAFNPLRNLFVKKSSALLPEPGNEQVTVFKNDVRTLFSPSESALQAGPDSRTFEAEAVKAGINGLIDGKITVYESYFSASCSLYVFPGRRIAGSITEVGPLRNLVSAAEKTAAYFSSVIANSLPVEILFDIQPEECQENASVLFDGKKYSTVPEKISTVPGIHSVEIECQGYISRAATYAFKGASRFLVRGTLEPERDIQASLLLKNPRAGTLYSGTDFIADISPENPQAQISFDGTAVIGQFQSDSDPSLFFYYIPESMQKDGAVLSVNGKPLNHSELIDTRRKSAYRAYTALVVSMPFTLYTVGKYNSMANAYNAGSLNDREQVKRWQRYGYISSGITFACLGYFAFELIRYFIAANSILPAQASYHEPEEIEKSAESGYTALSPGGADVQEDSGSRHEAESGE